MAALSPATRALWSLRAAKAPVPRASLICSQRFFHMTRSVCNDDQQKTEPTQNSTESAATGLENAGEGSGQAEAQEQEEEQVEEEEEVEEDVKVPHRRKRFHKWLQGDGQRFAKITAAGTNYVGDVPFPMNPLFKPTPPLSDFAKEEIYKLHRSDTSKWTPRQLGMRYNISIMRVEAILRLKHLETEMISDGFVPQVNFTKGMERLMGVKAERSYSIFEPLTDILPQVGSPKFEAVDEDKTFTAVDAARVLKRRPLAEIKAQQLEQEKLNPFKLVDSINGVPRPEPVQTSPISRNSSESSRRFKFTITDTSSNSTLIREKDGTLHKVV